MLHTAPPELFFLSYLSRSGSTLLSQLLSERFSVCVMPEASVPAEFIGVNSMTPPTFSNKDEAAQYLESIQAVSKLRDWGEAGTALPDDLTYPISAPQLFASLARAYRDMVSPADPIVVYKGDPVMPWQAEAALHQMPHAKVIFMMRDPRAVLHSQIQSEYAYTGGTFSFSPAHTAREWAALAHAVRDPGDRAHVLRYEDLVLRPLETLELLARFLGAETREAVQETSFSDRIAVAERHLHSKVTQPPDPARIDRWREGLDPQHWAILEHLLKGQMEAFGYTPDAPIPAPHSSVLLAKLRDRIGNIRYSTNRYATMAREDPRYMLQKFRARLKRLKRQDQ